MLKRSSHVPACTPNRELPILELRQSCQRMQRGSARSRRRLTRLGARKREGGRKGFPACVGGEGGGQGGAWRMSLHIPAHACNASCGGAAGCWRAEREAGPADGRPRRQRLQAAWCMRIAMLGCCLAYDSWGQESSLGRSTDEHACAPLITRQLQKSPECKIEHACRGIFFSVRHDARVKRRHAWPWHANVAIPSCIAAVAHLAAADS